MDFYKKKWFFFLLCCCNFIVLKSIGQSTSNNNTHPFFQKQITVKNISITGNKKTKDYIILRELQLKNGDTLESALLSKRLETARNFIYNSTLFHEVKIIVDTLSANEINIGVVVKERWYIFPIPQFQLVDRSFNDWKNNHNADFDRVNYGFRFTHFNLTGRKDQLKLIVLNGYSKNILFSYTQPYSNSALTEGFGVNMGYSQIKELPFKTSYNNKSVYYKPTHFSSKLFLINGAYIIRKNVRKRHLFNIGFSRVAVDDSLVLSRYNDNYFNSTSAKQTIVDFSYNFQFVDVDNVAYPLKGKVYYFGVSKKGIGIKGGLNALSIGGGYSKYFKLPKNNFADFQTFGNIKLPFTQAYVNQRALGYGETYLRGLDNYVIDGVALGLIKTTFKKRICHFVIPLPIKLSALPNIPVSIFAKIYSDWGYVYSQKKYDTYLSNRLLYTSGFGIDILSAYDASLRIEYSFNQLNQKGLFLRIQTGF